MCDVLLLATSMRGKLKNTIIWVWYAFNMVDSVTILDLSLSKFIMENGVWMRQIDNLPESAYQNQFWYIVWCSFEHEAIGRGERSIDEEKSDWGRLNNSY